MSGGAVARRLATPDGRPVAGTLTMVDPAGGQAARAASGDDGVEIDIQAVRG